MSPPPWRSRRCSARNRAARTSASNIPIATTPIISSTAWRAIAATRRRRSATAMSSLPGRSRPSASMAEPRHERDHHARGAALSSRDRQRAVFPALHGTLPGRLGGARRAQSHQGSSRRHAVVPLVLPHGGVRQLRHDDQRRAETVLPHLPARLPRRRDPCRAARHFPIERDLVIVMDSFMDKLSSVKPWLIPKQDKPLSAGEYLQKPAELNTFHSY